MLLRKNASNFAGLRLQIEYLDPRQFVPAENRTRKHSKVKIKKLARSIADHGMLLPIRINAGGRVLGGHALLEAALSLNEANVPVVTIVGSGAFLTRFLHKLTASGSSTNGLQEQTTAHEEQAKGRERVIS